MAYYNNENINPNLLSHSVSSMASNISRSYDKNGKHENSVSQIRNRDSIMKVFVSDKEDINAINECGWTPLYRTIIGGNNKATEIMLKYGANPNIKCSMGETALFQAVEMESLSQVETLLKFKADPNIPQADGLIPLHAATIKQNIQVVELLLKYGSNPNYENKLFLQTPVHYAIKHSVKPAILMMLVRYNGSLSIRDKNKKRPIDYVESDEIRDTLNMLKMENEDAFKTPQKQSNISYINNTNSYKRNSGVTLGQTFTPSKTANIVFSKLAQRSASDNKDFIYNTVGGNIQNNLFYNMCNDNEFKLEENEENKRRDSENILIQNQYINTSRDLNYSQTEYINTCNKEENNFTINMENRFDSFVTKEGALFSKLNTPKTQEDGGISDMNPLDTLYSAGNTIKSNHNSLKKNMEQTAQGFRRDMNYKRSRANTPEKENYSIPQITENEVEESTEKKDRVSEFVDDSLEENEELVPMDLMNCKLNQADYSDALKNDLYSSRNDRTEVEITYTPSKISYIISDLPQTSKKKNNMEISVIERNNCHFKNNSDVIVSDNRIIAKKINFNKINYHNKGKESKDLNSVNNQTYDNVNANSNSNNSVNNRGTIIQNNHNQNMISSKLKNTIHLNEIDYKLNSNNFLPSPTERKINLSPSYKKRMNFSKNKSTSPTNSVQNSYRNNTCGSNCNAQMAIPYNTLISADEERLVQGNYNKNTGANSTRQTSAQYYMEDNYNNNYSGNGNHPPRERGNKKAHLNETINTGHECSNSNRTIIHYGDAGSNRIKKLKQISVLTNFSRRNSPKSFCRRSPGGDCLDTIYCMNTETSKSNISTMDAKKLHDWLNSIGMLNYYNNFLENGLFSIDELIKGMEDSTTRIAYKDFEEIGVRKPGHIYKMLIKLELDGKYIDEAVSQFIFEKTKTADTNCNNVHLNMPNYSLKLSGDKYVCCGLMNKASERSKNSTDVNAKNVPYMKHDLISWLKMSKLPHLRKNFLHNGFDSVEFFILQMFSSYPFDDQMIEDCLHIYSKKERKTILSQLNREAMLVSNRLMNMTYINTKSYDSDLSSSFKAEKTKIDDGCKMCTIF